MVAGTCATGENFKLTTAVCCLSMHTHCARLYAPIMWQHMPEPGGSFTFSYFDIAIVNSISSCPHDSTDKSRQACDSLSVPYLKDMSEFVCVLVRACVNVLEQKGFKLTNCRRQHYESEKASACGGGGGRLNKKGGG